MTATAERAINRFKESGNGEGYAYTTFLDEVGKTVEFLLENGYEVRTFKVDTELYKIEIN